MQTGTKLSGVAHLVVISAAVFGGAFRSDPLPFEVHEVSVISASDFAALSASKVPPVVSDQPAALSPPDPAIDAPDQVKAGEFFDVRVGLGKEIAHPNTTEHPGSVPVSPYHEYNCLYLNT